MQRIKDHLYSARWAVTKAINEKTFEPLDFAKDEITKALDATADQEPERPNQSDEHKYEKPEYEKPEIVEVNTSVRTQGNYRTNSGRAKGLVVHYTAGRFNKGRESAINTLKYLAGKGLGCLVMDTEGVIYKARNQDLDEVAWHAGSSSWKGKSGISRYCIGMEICNAGLLDNNNKAWFGQAIPAEQVRETSGEANIKPGRYHKFTEAQEKSLINFILWQAYTNPEFDLDWLVGHDEIAPTRKWDPGASLSMTMPELRAKIKSML